MFDFADDSLISQSIAFKNAFPMQLEVRRSTLYNSSSSRPVFHCRTTNRGLVLNQPQQIPKQNHNGDLADRRHINRRFLLDFRSEVLQAKSAKNEDQI